MKTISALLLLSLCSLTSFAQQPINTNSLEYGNPVNLGTAKKIMAAAEALAIKNQWTVVIAIVDAGGNLVQLQRMDNAQIGSIELAIGKARTANNFKRSSKVFEDMVAGGGLGLRALSIPGVLTLEGGELIISNDKIIGAIGVSGMSAAQDAEVAKAGLAAFNK
jgi:uncharacterized protein GlcG (DUF336 family)